ncbi:MULTISPECIES: bifunctional RNase H/acid phosphatase [unclassified Corynebacterium]|uniref:bifunctional RNase H/acid phosphatase n=1 Tax=unclassified Corynebacterium TaxID=2624378 RepID=UPI0029CA8EFE|nr:MULTISPECIES: bifunctional RNase H/acid phosphatase [unclassified Corynebacterium]WPF65509.1 bifunctional RNase H/acid phosphatase [Corynebacterium sp. 22KM0430]WPF68005.1 bifunctional RNase H/acid phosphatase [Corynebacterium sp. 21KM1197]
MKVCIEADGGSRGNPGIAGSGSVLYDAPRATVLREQAYVVGKSATNNVAEYYGLLIGLEAARDYGATEVAVYMDSKLVVEQMSGRWKIKHPDMQKLARRAKQVMSTFDSVTFQWVPREKNKKADALSNVAMDAAARGAKPGMVKDTGAVFAEVGSARPEGGARARSDSSAVVSASEGMTTAAQWLNPEEKPITRLILVRHGETEHTVRGCYSGQSDPDLTQKGTAQAERAARVVRSLVGDVTPTILSSPLTRTRRTAQKVAQAVAGSVTVEEGLIEVDFGDWDGKEIARAQTENPRLHSAWLKDTSVAPPGGESLDDLHRRITALCRRLLQEHEGSTVVLVSHVNPIKSLLRQALGGGPEFFHRVFVDVASVSVVEFIGERGLIRGINIGRGGESAAP